MLRKLLLSCLIVAISGWITIPKIYAVCTGDNCHVCVGCLNPPPGYVFYSTDICALGPRYCPGDGVLVGACITAINPNDIPRWSTASGCEFYRGTPSCDFGPEPPIDSEYCATAGLRAANSSGGLSYCNLVCPASYIQVGDHRVYDRATGQLIFREFFVPSLCEQVLYCITGPQPE